MMSVLNLIKGLHTLELFPIFVPFLHILHPLSFIDQILIQLKLIGDGVESLVFELT